MKSFGEISRVGLYGSITEPVTQSEEGFAICLQSKRVEITVRIARDPLTGLSSYLATGKGVTVCACLTIPMPGLWGSPKYLEYTNGGAFDYISEDDNGLIEGSVASGKFKVRYVENKEICRCATNGYGYGISGGWEFLGNCRCKATGEPIYFTQRSQGEPRVDGFERAANKMLSDLADCQQ